MIQYAILSCFTFAAKSGVNGGIISAIFSSSCIFTIIIFYFKYGHQVSLVDSVGTVFILLCVLLIAFGGSGGQTEEEQKTEEQIKTERLNLILALALAIISGFTLSLNTVSIQYTIYTGFDLDQANYDGNLMLGLIFLPFYIYHRDKYNLGDLVIGTLVVICVTTGVILFSKAIQCGVAGPVQAIENSKTVVQTLLCIIFLGQIPTVMQIAGLLTGMIGVISIVLQKKKDVEAK
jgi:drug/metabolite transporter (DMT)-like permease